MRAGAASVADLSSLPETPIRSKISERYGCCVRSDIGDIGRVRVRDGATR